MKIAICDDMQIFRDELCETLQKYSNKNKKKKSLILITILFLVAKYILIPPTKVTIVKNIIKETTIAYSLGILFSFDTFLYLFMKHNGFSERAIRQAIAERKEGKRMRGGSTISQQTAKNVFTFCSRTWFRKGVETYYTILIELIWGKERIMEAYLNVVELGDGIYGAEAASRHYWGISANQLSKGQSALLAAALPNPLHYSITRPGPYMQKRKGQILNLMPKMGKIEF